MPEQLTCPYRCTDGHNHRLTLRTAAGGNGGPCVRAEAVNLAPAGTPSSCG